MLPIDQPTRIFVLRALQLGDMLCAVPALHALRATFPRAHVTLVGLPWAAELVDRYPTLLDDHLTFPGFPGIDERPLDAVGLAEFVTRVSADPPDLAIQLHGSGVASNGFTALLGARQAVGSYRPGTWRPGPGFVPYRDDLPEIDRLLAVLRGNGIHGEARQDFPLQAADRDELAAAMPGLERETYVCLHPGARDPRRRWPPERFAALGDELADAGYRVLLTGTDDDRDAHDAVRAAARRPPESLAGRLSLGAFAALLDGSALLVTNDTGASHLAAALGVPSVVIFVASDPARWAPADGVRHRALGGPVERVARHCCLGDACGDRVPHWRDVTPDEVRMAVDEQLAGRSLHAA
jgi:ADP-heptose:LPS heptosyltransferase